MQVEIMNHESMRNLHGKCCHHNSLRFGNTNVALPDITTTAMLYVNPHGRRQLSPTFRPGCFDVICARGKAAYDHEGNKRFRAIVKMHKQAYSQASTKYHKSQIVSHITNTIRQASPLGGFVKKIDGCWWEVGDRLAKEKIGQTFRDLLDQQYSSSTKAKARARTQRYVDDCRSECLGPEEQTRSQPNYTSESMSCSMSVVFKASTKSRNIDHKRIVNDLRGHNTDIRPNDEESCLFDTLVKILDPPLTVSSDDLEPLPLDFPCHGILK